MRSLESSSEPSLKVIVASASQSFELIDGQVGKDDRLRIFDLELRGIGGGIGEGADASAASETPEQLRIAPLIAASAFWIKTRPARSIGTGSHPDQVYATTPRTRPTISAVRPNA